MKVTIVSDAYLRSLVQKIESPKKGPAVDFRHEDGNLAVATKSEVEKENN